MDEFCPEEARFSVEADEVTLAGRVSFLEPSLPSLQAAMREAYADRALVRRRGKVAAAVASALTWDAVTRALVVEAWHAR